MNYRHAYHAGNFADVFKHAFLALLLTRLGQKPTPFRVIDTHAGVGLYDLAGAEAARTREWECGVGRLDAATASPEAEALLGPYRAVLAQVRAEHGPQAYPGSPEIARRLSRRQDRLVFVEKHPQDAATLTAAVGRDRRARVVELDGWTALNAFVPPPERRGLVLVDPPFEKTDEFEVMGRAVVRAWTKWPTGLYVIWHPVKAPRHVDTFVSALAAGGLRKILRLEIGAPPAREGGLDRCGLVIVNPPWRLDDDAALLLPTLARVFGSNTHAFRHEWAVPE